MPTPAEQTDWLSSYPTNNIGLPLGAQSRLGMIDIDTDDEQVIATIKSLLPATPWERRGKKGMALAYRWNGQRNFKIKGVDGTMLVEHLSEGNQVVLPPSIHPDTARPYTATANLWEVLDDIPELPSDFEVRLRADLYAAGLIASPATGTRPGAGSRGGVVIDIPAEHGIDRFLAEALAAACDAVLAAQEGGRNTKLFGQAKDLARHVAAAEADWTPFAETLHKAALTIGLEDGEAVASILSGWNSGSIEPTAWLPIASQYIYLGAQDRFYHPASGSDLPAAGFNGLYGRVHDAKGTFSQFLTGNGYISKVQDITYIPGQEPGVQVVDGMPYFNVYRPSDVTATLGDAGPFSEFLEFLVPGELERSHLIQFMAHVVRNPGNRIRHALLLRSRHQGIGKSMLFEIWGKLVGTSNVRFTSSREMAGNFDGWKTQNVTLICPELNIGHGMSAYNDIKAFISDDFATVNEKHLKARRWPIYSTSLFSTNLDVPMLIEANDRRLFVIDTPATPRSAAYYAEFADWWSKSLGVIRHFLDEVDLSDFNPHAPPPMTEAKLRLIQRSGTPLVQDIAFLIQERKGRLSRDVITVEEVAEELRGNRVADRVIATALRELGAVAIGQQRTRFGRKSLWIIRNHAIWQKWTIAERVKEYERREGLFSCGLSGLDEHDFDVAFLSELTEENIESKLDALKSSTLLAL
ncbi:bifunctional DNA primase/polymerase [Novosphingobium resinovorum]|uniref:bifunctional DNA primase/polymerase n=1 Tax=Novosphingobium resinovorum TaxID=158500 RepID=UPI002ED35D5B|nr:bifunctional DNA primase/polymerase [Novosphingobium resinovorum]